MAPGAASPSADSGNVHDPAEIRAQIAHSLGLRAPAIISSAVAVFPFASAGGLETGFGAKLADLLVQLLAEAVVTGHIDARMGPLTELRQLVPDKGVSVRQLFDISYVIERAALDELVLDETIGSTSEQWPAIAQMVRRATLEVLSAFSTHVAMEPPDSAVIDPLTTLHTRAVFVAVLDKEIQRLERFHHPFALILFDVDRIAELNARHGYGAGDRVLERIGIIVRNYFREQDWVARCSGDTLGVLLPETTRENAEQLADRVRTMVAERLELSDYRTEERIPVTVSVGLLIAESVDKDVRAEQLIEMAKQAVDRAKAGGRNRVCSEDTAAPAPA